jgi:hypothetical protein
LNHESEQERPKTEQYVVLDIGGANELAIPMECFLEYNSDLVVIGSDGYGSTRELKIMPEPIGFKLVSGADIRVLQVKAKLLAEKPPKD